jgi:predicted NBD/HSP70 family sugar kinase
MLTVHMRQTNRAEVLRRLIAAGRITRAELARATGLSKATVTRVVDDLLTSGIVRERRRTDRRAGMRRGLELELIDELGAVCGVDVGATNTRVVVGDLSGSPVLVERHATPGGTSPPALAEWLADRISGAVDRAGGADLWATGVGLPAVVHPRTDDISSAPNLPAIEGTDFVAALRERLPAEVRFDNDANLALQGELSYGAARGHDAAVMFTLGTGVGAAVVVDGRLLRGRAGFVGEFGAVPLGRDGRTLEQAMGAADLIRRAREAGHDLASAEPVFDPGAPAALAALREEALGGLAAAFAAVTAAYEPEVLIVAGGVVPSLLHWLPAVERDLRAAIAVAPPVVHAEAGDLAGALGGIARGLETAYARLDLEQPVGAAPLRGVTDDVRHLLATADRRDP